MRLLLFSIIIISLTSCSGQAPHVKTIGPERDIVLVNIQNGDRAFISKILSKVDSIKPKVIGIDIYFKQAKVSEDTILFNAFNKLRGDILSYGLSSNNVEDHSIALFTDAVNDEGFLDFEEENGLVSNMTPVKQVDGKRHESFALKLAKLWKPNLNNSYSENTSIPIDYSRTLNSFLIINGSDLIELPLVEFDSDNLKNKIFLIGYAGPKDEDMYRTPLRFLYKDSLAQKQPDTYGIVIVGNQIRTLLDRDSK